MTEKRYKNFLLSFPKAVIGNLYRIVTAENIK